MKERPRCRTMILRLGFIPHPHDPKWILGPDGLRALFISDGMLKQFRKMVQEGAFPPHPPLGPVQRCTEHSRCKDTCLYRPILRQGQKLCLHVLRTYAQLDAWKRGEFRGRRVTRGVLRAGTWEEV